MTAKILIFLKKILYSNYAVVVWTILVVLLSLLPGGNIPKTPDIIPHFDKTGHFGMYFLYAVFLWYSPLFIRQPMANSVLFTLFIFFYCTLFGAAMEWLQTAVSERTADIFDMLANASGAVCALLCIHVWKRFFERGSSDN